MSSSTEIATTADSEAVSLPFRLPRGEIVEIEGVRFEFARRFPTGRYEFRNLNTDEPYVVESRKLLLFYIERKFRMLGNGEMRPVELSRISLDLSTLNEKEKHQLQRWHTYVTRYLAQPCKKTAKELRPFIAAVAEEIKDTEPPAWQSLIRKIREYESAGHDTRALIPLNRQKGSPYQSRLSPEQDAKIEEAIDSVYLTRGQFSKGDVVNRVKNLIAKENETRGSGITHIPTPHDSTIYRRLQNVDDYLKTVAREGQRAADAKFKPGLAGPKATRIGEVYEIDHHLIDVSMIDETTGFLLGRPWLTLVIDRYSRAIVGYYLSFLSPSWHSIAMALRHAIAPKPGLRIYTGNSYVIWDAFGKPELIVIDNGPDFRSIHLDEACSRLPTNVLRAPRKKPEYKGMIEGWFGRMTKRYAQKLPNTTRSNPKALGDDRPKVQRAITLQVFEEKFVEWVLCDYNRHINRKMKSNPETRWREGAMLHPPQLPKSIEDMNVLLMYVNRRRLRRDGVQLNNILYNSNDVARIRAECGENISVQVRYDRTNLNEIYITHPKTGEQTPVPSTTPDYTDGLSLDLHRAVWAYTTAQAKKQVNATDLARYRDEVTLSHQKALGDRRMTARRKAKIMLDLTSTGHMPGKVRVSDIESRMDLFDQVFSDVETDTLETGVREGSSVEFPEVQAYSAAVVKKPKAPARKPPKRLPPAGKTQPMAYEASHPPSSLPKDERQTFTTGFTEGITGIPMAQLDAPADKPSTPEEER